MADEPVSFGGLMIVPSGMSQERAERVLPLEGSEDVRALLFAPLGLTPPARAPSGPASDDDIGDVAGFEFEPCPHVEWVATADLPNKPAREDVCDVCTDERLELLGACTVYIAAENGEWTTIHDEEVARVARIAVAVPLVEVEALEDEEDEDANEERVGDEDDDDDDDDGVYLRSAEEFQSLGEDVAELFGELGALTVKESWSPDAAAERAEVLASYREQFGQPFRVVLRAPTGRPFDGRAVWDTMMSLGLVWSDFDLFHFADPAVPTAVSLGDSWIVVSTTTAPGYFLPEAIAQGARFEDLVFELSLTRCRAPLAAFEVLQRAVAYAMKRLGGKDLREDGEPFPWEDSRRSLPAYIKALEDAGLAPGSEAALRLF